MRESTHGSTIVPRRRLPWLPALFVLTALLPAAIAYAQPSAPPVAPGTVSLDVTCSPDTFQPDTWVVVVCDTRLTNNGNEAIGAGGVNVGSESGPVPEYYWVSLVRDGRYEPVASASLGFDTQPLQPGETFEFTLTALMRMSEGTWRGTDALFVGEEEVVRVPLKLVADSDAATLPENLRVTTTLTNGEPDELTPLPSAIYETVIENRGPTPVTALTLTERIDNVNLINVDPAPSSIFREDELSLVSWILPSFDIDSLAPGESLLVRTEYGPIDASGCSGVSTGLVLEANVGGTIERYGLRPSSAALLGDCSFEEGTSGGRGGPIGFGRGGEGPGEATFDVVWTAAFLAVGGATLFALATLARRRGRW